jgi:hypothetical protein
MSSYVNKLIIFKEYNLNLENVLFNLNIEVVLTL